MSTRNVLQLSPPIHTTLANVVLISTLHRPFPTQTACGLYVLSSSSTVLCVPWTLSRGATTVILAKLLWTWCSLVPLRICTFKPLAPWRPKELGSCTSPLLSLPSMLAELRTSLGGCHSFLASLTETPHLLFRTSMLLDRSRPLNTAVLTDQARDLAGAVTFTRSTPGCGTLAGPSLESAGCRSQKPKGYADCPNVPARSRNQTGQEAGC